MIEEVNLHQKTYKMKTKISSLRAFLNRRQGCRRNAITFELVDQFSKFKMFQKDI